MVKGKWGKVEFVAVTKSASSTCGYCYIPEVELLESRCAFIVFVYLEKGQTVHILRLPWS